MNKKFVFGLLAAGLALVGCSDDESTVVASYTDYELNGIILRDGYYTDYRDGRKYMVHKFGSQYWLAENMAFEGDSTDEYKVILENSWCHGDSKDSCERYGRLYSYDAAMSACPHGWHLPSKYEWDALISNVGGMTSAGTFLKSVKYWDNADSVSQGMNLYGFNGLPGGRHNADGGDLPTGKTGYFWSDNEISSELAKGYQLSYENDYMLNGEYYRDHGMSVRCIVSKNDDLVFDGGLDSTFLREIPHQYGSVEIEGQEYKTITYGDMEVMVENLNADVGNNWCYENKSENCKKYGRLYDYGTASKICPEGWGLIGYNSAKANAPTSLYESVVTGNLKYIRDTTSWTKGETLYDMWGFNLQAAGGYDMGQMTFFDMGMTAYLWTDAWVWDMNLSTTHQVLVATYGSSEFQKKTEENKAYPVRCVRQN